MRPVQTKPTTSKAPGSADAKPQPPVKPPPPGHTITFTDDPNDPAVLRRDVKDFFVNTVGANVFAGQVRPFVNYSGDAAEETARRCAETFVAAIKESLQPRDALEEMLVLQMAWTHARLAALSVIKPAQENVQALRALNDACDRAAGTFRKQMLALAEYRRPPRTDSFVAIKQANLANQQVIHNDQSQNSARSVASNELGSSPAPALPPHAEGVGVAATGCPAQQALGIEHGPQDAAGEGPRQQERREAR